MNYLTIYPTSIDEKAIAQAVETLRDGGIIIYPTDTVYALGCDALNNRAHQLAMYVVYDAPLQMLTDSPTRYRANPECTQMISLVPTVFDESVTLDGKVGEYIVTTRCKGDTWYVGAMTNRTPRGVQIPLSFLGDGDYTMTYVADGINTDIDASDHKHASASVNASATVTADMAPAGGWMAIITPQR